MKTEGWFLCPGMKNSGKGDVRSFMASSRTYPPVANRGDTVYFGNRDKPEASDVLQVAPIDICTQNKPLIATVVSNTRETPDVHKIVFEIDNKLRWEPGQVIKVGMEKPLEGDLKSSVAFYSIANHYEPGKNRLELLVKRKHPPSEAQSVADYDKSWSNFLCDRKPGDQVALSGPVNEVLVLPKDPDIHVLAVCIGTGLAPIRAGLASRYNSNGKTMLIYGVSNPQSYLCGRELEQLALEDPDIKLLTAFSDQMPSEVEPTVSHRKETIVHSDAAVHYRWGGHVQDLLYEHREPILQLLEDPKTYFVLCGSKAMLENVVERLKQACQETGRDWDKLYATLTSENRWRVEAF